MGNRPKKAETQETTGTQGNTNSHTSERTQTNRDKLQGTATKKTRREASSTDWEEVIPKK